jgi:sec-independent protein translocase protein TatA
VLSAVGAAPLGEILGPDLLIVLVIVALLFGSTRLPKLARSLGQAKSEFEKGIHSVGAGPGASPADGDEKVTMTRAELDALVAEREARARRTNPDPGD